MITIRLIEKKEKITIQSEPFKIYGRMIPFYDGKQWTCQEELWEKEQCYEMCFPQEHYDSVQDEHYFIGAFEDQQCVGLAVLDDYYFRYMYLDNLMVSPKYRRQGIAGMLLDACTRIALEKGYLGLYTIGQDNNLSACRCYLNYGFEIKGIDSQVYFGSAQEGKTDIYFYYTAKKKM